MTDDLISKIGTFGQKIFGFQFEKAIVCEHCKTTIEPVRLKNKQDGIYLLSWFVILIILTILNSSSLIQYFPSDYYETFEVVLVFWKLMLSILWAIFLLVSLFCVITYVNQRNIFLRGG